MVLQTSFGVTSEPFRVHPVWRLNAVSICHEAPFVFLASTFISSALSAAKVTELGSVLLTLIA